VVNGEQRPYFTAAGRGRRLECLKVGRVLRPAAPNSAQMTWAFDFSAQGVRRLTRLVAGALGPRAGATFNIAPRPRR
jgi:hypothetical protein